MARRSKVSRFNKERLEYLVGRYQKVFDELEPGITPQEHKAVPGQTWTRRQALEVAYLFMNAAIDWYDTSLEDSFEFFYLARGIAMAHSAIPVVDGLIPEPTLQHVTKKPS